MAQRSFAEIRRERERWARPVGAVPKNGEPMMGDATTGTNLTHGSIETKKPTNLASKAGRFAYSRNFLATDKVPDSIFGFPIVSRREDYTEEDLAFFREHPEAGGYYDMGSENGDMEPAPPAGRGADKGGKSRGAYPGSWNNPGNVRPGAADYAGRTGTAVGRSGTRFLTFDTPQNGLNAMADVVRQIATMKIQERFNEERLADDRFTPRTLVEVYAPPEDGNDVDDYTDFVGGKLGVGPNDELRLDDTEKMADLLEAMVRRDSGHPHADWFTRQEYIDAAKRMKGVK